MIKKPWNLYRQNLLKQKKAVFFTFAAVFMVIILVGIITASNSYRYREKSLTISSRIRTMNNFITDFEKDIDRELYIGGYRALISVNAYMRILQGYVPDLDSSFTEILMNGTANGTTMSIMKQKDGIDTEKGADIKSWLSRVNEEASKMNIQIEITMNDISVVHSSPWNVTVSLNTTVNITDRKGLASWLYTKVYSIDFPILGFEDPLYVAATSDRMSNTINITPDFDFVNDSTGTAANLNTHILQSFYINSTKAPSFLMRYSGNFSNSTYGIESMVNLDDYFAQFGYFKARSVIDYIYFGNQTFLPNSNYCDVTGVPSWFRIDGDHITLYEVDKLNKTAC